MLRRTAELLSRGITFQRTLPPQYGGAKLFASPEGGLRYWGRIERTDPVLLDSAREWIRPGDSVWDIGANIGLFTFAAAGLAGGHGRVLAVEPDTWCVDLLRRSSALNPQLAPVTV